MKISRRQALQSTAVVTGSLVLPKALLSAEKEKPKYTKPFIPQAAKERKIHVIRLATTFEHKQCFVMDDTKYMEVIVGKRDQPYSATVPELHAIMEALQKAFTGLNNRVIFNYDKVEISVKPVKNTIYFGGRVIVVPRHCIAIDPIFIPNGGGVPREFQFNIYDEFGKYIASRRC